MDAEKTGKLIKELRTEKGLTQKELASLLKVSPTAVSKWENGRNLPDISMLEPLAEALGVSIYELVMGKAAGTAAAAASEGKEAKENDADTAIRSIITESIVQKKKSGRRHVISTICGILLIGLFCISFLIVRAIAEGNITERSSQMKEELQSQGYIQLQNISFQDGIVCYTATTDQEKILGIQDMLLLRAEREQARFEAMRSPRLFHRYSALRQVIVSPNGTILYDQKLMNYATVSEDDTESLYISEHKPAHSKEETTAALKESFRQNGLSLEVTECSEYSLGGYQVTLSYKDEKGTMPDIDTIKAAG